MIITLILLHVVIGWFVASAVILKTENDGFEDRAQLASAAIFVLFWEVLIVLFVIPYVIRNIIVYIKTLSNERKHRK